MLTATTLNSPSDITLGWLKLSLIPGISSRTLCKLHSRWSDPTEILEMIGQGGWQHWPLQRSAKDWLGRNDRTLDAVLAPQLDKTKRWLESGGFIVDWQDAAYPALLREIYDPPAVLYGLGQPHLLSAHPCLAVVGSRKASRYGLEVARTFAHQLTHQGWQVVSGLALGVDAAAHKGSLNGLKEGAIASTTAVVATGLDQTYPASHRALKEEIMAHGCVLSEYPLGTLPKANFFPRRNRIISGLSRGVLVVEASQQSGSLVSARCALEQNRDVFAIPGIITNPQAEGCHTLIQQGAKLVTRVEDILEEYADLRAGTVTGQPKPGHQHSMFSDDTLISSIMKPPSVLPNPISSAQPSQIQPASSQPENPILAAMGLHTTTADELMVRTGMAWPELSQSLLRLELAGLIESTTGGYCLKSG